MVKIKFPISENNAYLCKSELRQGTAASPIFFIGNMIFAYGQSIDI